RRHGNFRILVVPKWDGGQQSVGCCVDYRHGLNISICQHIQVRKVGAQRHGANQTESVESNDFLYSIRRRIDDDHSRRTRLRYIKAGTVRTNCKMTPVERDGRLHDIGRCVDDRQCIGYLDSYIEPASVWAGYWRPRNTFVLVVWEWDSSGDGTRRPV